jgi:Cu/Ag efflux protein CusF
MLNMKNHVFASCVLMTAAVFAGTGCSSAPKPDATAATPAANVKTYPMTAEVMGLDASGKVATLKHEKIEGLMDAMTMGYPVKDLAEFGKLAVGEKITATVNVSPDDMWVSNIKKVQ